MNVCEMQRIAASDDPCGELAKATECLDERAQIGAVNTYFRYTDESHLWPVCGRFNATERAIRNLRKQRAEGCGPHAGLEYILGLDAEISRVVNAAV